MQWLLLSFQPNRVALTERGELLIYFNVRMIRGRVDCVRYAAMESGHVLNPCKSHALPDPAQVPNIAINESESLLSPLFPFEYILVGIF